jgi:VanZ family protein
MRLGWLPVFLWMGLIFYLSHQDGNTSTMQSGVVLDFFKSLGMNIPVDALPKYAGFIRKAAHFTEYAILYFLLSRIPLKPFTCFSVLLLFSLSDEWHQSFIPGRSGQLSDVAIDLMGGLFVMVLLRYYKIFRRKHK